MQYFNYRLSNTELRGHVDQHKVDALLISSKEVVVRGNKYSGKKPHINFAYTSYSSEALGSSFQFVGQKITIEFDENDLRIVTAYINGSLIGRLKAAPPWHLVPHSLNLRRAIHSCVNKKKINLTPKSNPIEKYADYIERNSKKGRVTSNLYIQARQYLTKYVEELKVYEEQEVEVIQNSKVNNEGLSEPVKLPPPKKARC